MREPSVLDIVTRLFDLADLPCLERLVFSVMAQQGAGSLRLHVMLQRFSAAEVQAVRAVIGPLRGLGDDVSVTLHNWDYPAPFNLRVPLLNWGLDVAQGRYFTCVDVFDQLHSHACATLLHRLGTTAAAIATGRAVQQSVCWWGNVVVPVPDPPEASPPPPFFLIDRDRLGLKDCVFRNSPSEAEVDEFIARLAASYPADAEGGGGIVAVRQVPGAISPRP